MPDRSEGRPDGKEDEAVRIISEAGSILARYNKVKLNDMLIDCLSDLVSVLQKFAKQRQGVDKEYFIVFNKASEIAHCMQHGLHEIVKSMLLAIDQDMRDITYNEYLYQALIGLLEG